MKTRPHLREKKKTLFKELRPHLLVHYPSGFQKANYETNWRVKHKDTWFLCWRTQRHKGRFDEVLVQEIIRLVQIAEIKEYKSQNPRDIKDLSKNIPK